MHQSALIPNKQEVRGFLNQHYLVKYEHCARLGYPYILWSEPSINLLKTINQPKILSFILSKYYIIPIYTALIS
jgi:hypothetical protein